MRIRKVNSYRPFFSEMEAWYMPMVWSAFGREDAATSAVLETLARAAARRRGLRDHEPLLRRTLTAIGVALVTHAVRMTRGCLPLDDEAALSGGGAVTRVVAL